MSILKGYNSVVDHLKVCIKKCQKNDSCVFCAYLKPPGIKAIFLKCQLKLIRLLYFYPCFLRIFMQRSSFLLKESGVLHDKQKQMVHYIQWLHKNTFQTIFLFWYFSHNNIYINKILFTELLLGFVALR